MPSQLAQLVRTTNILSLVKEHINALSEENSLELTDDDKKLWEDSFNNKFIQFLRYIKEINYIKENEIHDEGQNDLKFTQIQQLIENEVEPVNSSPDIIGPNFSIEIKSLSKNHENTSTSKNVWEAVERFENWSNDQDTLELNNDILQLNVKPSGADFAIILDGMTIFVDLKTKIEENKTKAIWSFFPPLFRGGDGQRDE